MSIQNVLRKDFPTSVLLNKSKHGSTYFSKLIILIIAIFNIVML